MADFKKMNEEPIEYGGYQLFFYKTKYAYDKTLAIVCETDLGEPYATVSLNLGDHGYFPMPNEIFFDHNLPRAFKDMLCERFCDCNLSSCDEVTFGPYNTQTERVTILGKYL